MRKRHSKVSIKVVNAAHLLCARGDSKIAQENMDLFRDIWQDKVRLLTMAIDSIMTLDDFLAVSEAHIVEDAMTGLQVVNAAHLLCARGDSKIAQENMDLFRDIWQDKVRLLTMAIDSIMTLDDFLAVSEAHIVEDAMTGLQAVHEGDGDMLDRASGAIRGRSLRVCSAVDAEMDALQPSAYTERVKLATRRLRDEMLSQYAVRAEAVVTRLEATGSNSTQEERDRDSDEFINACTLVHDAVKEIRNALLVNRHPEDVDSDNEYEDDGQTNAPDNTSRISEGENQQRIMRRLPEEDKKRIQEQIDVFKVKWCQYNA
ncbi:unnamed protein product [Strongylus vulgaris]|uniref:Vinculin n=1 Tax=Strongylus vulgaris TaxID=40348 RepID=A0A3P7LK11_STRVU|nr:unnamed protein product [Strongylus vulgaris]